MKRYQPYLGEVIRELRAEIGFRNQDDLAEAAEIDVRTVRSVERGGTVQVASLAAICRSINISIDGLKERAVERQRSVGVEANESEAGALDAANGQSFSGISKELDRIDADVRQVFGPLTAPTREDGITEFSSRRIVSSMSTLGIPPEVVFRILSRLPAALSRYVPDDGVLSTNHIRSAVAQLISGLDLEDVADTDVFRFRAEAASRGGTAHHKDHASLEEIKFNWASRYARRYGNPNQIMRVLEDNGRDRRLDYAFIKGELIPQVLRRVLGDDFSLELGTLVNPSIVAEMARTTLEEFRRLGLYTLRYRTALWLTEDLAIHPPHPWMVSEETREITIKYDFERADANLDGLRNTDEASGFSTKHRFSEVVHHLCSGILAAYNGFLGHRQASSLHMLRHWLALENDNPILWAKCELRLIDSDLYACGISRQEFSSLLKRLDVALMARTIPPVSDLVGKCEKLHEYARRLHVRRAKMRRYNLAMATGGVDLQQYLPDLAAEIVFSCFGARKIYPIKDRQSGDHIGFSATPAFAGTVLEGRPPLCLFVACNGEGSAKNLAQTCERAVDQLNAHRLAETCVILCAKGPPQRFKEAVKRAEHSLPGSQILRVFHMEELRRRRKEMNSVAEFVDAVFAGSA